MLSLEIRPLDLKKDPVAALCVMVAEDKAVQAHRTLTALVKKAMEPAEFSGKIGEIMVWRDRTEVAARRVIFLGMGRAEKLTLESFRKGAARAAARAAALKCEHLALAAPSASAMGFETADLLQALMEGACLGSYRFEAYKSEPAEYTLSRLIVRVTGAEAAAHARLPETVTGLCGAVALARDWINTPSLDKRPPEFSIRLSAAARSAGLDVEILEKEALAEKKMESLLSVGRGSAAEPRLVIFSRRPAGAKKHIVLVGKGVTFDSGGLNLKREMAAMKSDMAGAAAVAGAAIAAAHTGLPCDVTAVMPLAENMPSGDAVRPGDVVRTYGGKTVEILNTDAEGRLILIDALSYAARRFSPDIMVDMATLTGACAVALGNGYAGVFSRHEELREAILAAGRHTHERCWPLPLPGDYAEELKSDVADLRNIGKNRWGGAIMAALFLKEFTGETPWAHIDMAGPAFSGKSGAYTAPGGTGFGVRLLWDLMRRMAE
ncbi:MAG: leucyl aminopeptidase [Desulfobacterales bacterium]|nr:MAG: leucyl aminopeptidase [Desulfobacterales bacterium]